jgi:hypothetical protein
MKHHQIAFLTRSTAVMTCVAALMFAAAGSAAAQPAQQLSEHGGEESQQLQPQQLSEHGGQQAEPAVVTNPRVGDTPADRVAPTAAPPAGESSTTSSSDGDNNAPLIIGLSLLTAALLGSGTYVVRRRRHVAPGH